MDAAWGMPDPVAFLEALGAWRDFVNPSAIRIWLLGSVYVWLHRQHASRTLTAQQAKQALQHCEDILQRIDASTSKHSQGFQSRHVLKMLQRTVSHLVAGFNASSGSGDSESRATAAAVAGAPVPAHTSLDKQACKTGVNGLPLPTPVLHQLFDLLSEDEDKAALGYTCQQLHAVYSTYGFLQLPTLMDEALRAYRAGMMDVWYEARCWSTCLKAWSEFGLCWPLDGCPVSGADLRADAAATRLSAELGINQQLSDLLAKLGVTDEVVKSVQAAAKHRPPPVPTSSPLAAFKQSAPVTFPSCFVDPPSNNTSGDGPTATSNAGSSSGCCSSRSSRSCVLTASCDVLHMQAAPPGSVLDLDGDTMACWVPPQNLYADSWDYHSEVWGKSDVALFNLSTPSSSNSSSSSAGGGDSNELSISKLPLHGGVFKVDSSNGLLWHYPCPVVHGRRYKQIGCDWSQQLTILAYRLPSPPGTTAPSTAATCNLGGGNGRVLQYVLRPSGDFAYYKNRGPGSLQVMGTKVLWIPDSGVVEMWDLSKMQVAPAMGQPRHSSIRSSSHSSAENGQHISSGSEHDEGDSLSNSSRSSSGSGSAASDDHVDDDRHHPGVPLLGEFDEAWWCGGYESTSVRLKPPLAGKWEEPQFNAGDVARGTDIERRGNEGFYTPCGTAVLPAHTGGSASLAIALKTGVLGVYDLETGKAQRALFGHPGIVPVITALQAAPSSWQQPHLLASCSYSGDVKLWDVRSSSGMAAVTLTTGSTCPLQALTLAAGDSSGMVCFAGGLGQSVWAWDVRRSSSDTSTAQAMYELSTGSMSVRSLAWHTGSNSLFMSGCWGFIQQAWGTDYVAVKRTHDLQTVGWDCTPQAAAERWPKSALHPPGAFRQPFAMYSSVLQYQFSAAASGRVPASQYAYLEDDRCPGCWDCGYSNKQQPPGRDVFRSAGEEGVYQVGNL